MGISSAADLTVLRPRRWWNAKGLTWEAFGDFNQSDIDDIIDIDGLKVQWFPADYEKRGIWAKHPQRQQGKLIYLFI